MDKVECKDFNETIMLLSGNEKERAPILAPEMEDEGRESPEVGEVKDKSTEIGEGAGSVLEGVESSEGVEVSGEKISETISEGKKKAPAGGFKGGTGTTQAGSGDYSFTIPKVEIMRIQISTKIHKEIVELEKEARKLIKSNSKFTPYKLNIVVKRIRSLKEILSELASATAETLKTLWLQFIKGISS